MKSGMQTKPFRGRVYEVKEGGGSTATLEPEVREAVLKEIKSLGDNVKAQVTELKSSHEALKKAVDNVKGEMDSMAESKVKKMTEDILTRQESLEKTLQKRGDDLELAIKKLSAAGGGRAAGSNEEKEFREAKEFLMHRLLAQKRLTKKGIKDEEVNVDELRQYAARFDMWMRTDEKNIMPEDWKYMTIGSDPDGGILVTPAMSARVIQRIWEMDPMRSLCNIETIGTDALEMMEDLDEVSAGWEGETTANDETSTAKWSKKRIPVHIQSARPKATQSQLDDASINLEAWLGNKVSNKFARLEAAAFVSGSGTNKPRGFLTYPDYTGGVKGDGGVVMGQIEQTNTGLAAGITTDGFLATKYSLVEDLLMSGTWMMNRLTVAETMKLKDGDGQYIWRPGITEGQPSSLLGLPLRMAKTMPTIAANALVAALADWREAYTIVDRQGITVQRDPYTKKPFVEFYTRRRVGGDVVNFQAIKLTKVSA